MWDLLILTLVIASTPDGIDGESVNVATQDNQPRTSPT